MHRRDFTKLSAFALAWTYLPSYAQNAGASPKPIGYAAVGLGDYGRVGNYIERQVARWSKQYEAADAERIPAMDQLIEFAGLANFATYFASPAS